MDTLYPDLAYDEHAGYWQDYDSATDSYYGEPLLHQCEDLPQLPYFWSQVHSLPYLFGGRLQAFHEVLSDLRAEFAALPECCQNHNYRAVQAFVLCVHPRQLCEVARPYSTALHPQEPSEPCSAQLYPIVPLVTQEPHELEAKESDTAAELNSQERSEQFQQVFLLRALLRAQAEEGYDGSASVSSSTAEEDDVADPTFAPDNAIAISLPSGGLRAVLLNLQV